MESCSKGNVLKHFKCLINESKRTQREDRARCVFVQAFLCFTHSGLCFHSNRLPLITLSRSTMNFSCYSSPALSLCQFSRIGCFTSSVPNYYNSCDISLFPSDRFSGAACLFWKLQMKTIKSNCNNVKIVLIIWPVNTVDIIIHFNICMQTNVCIASDNIMCNIISESGSESSWKPVENLE